LKRTLPALAGLILVWWFTALLVQQPFLPPPWAVFIEMIIQFKEGFLGPHIAVSLFRVISALIAAFIPAFILGVSAGMHKKADNVISPVVYILFPIPKVALLPIILLFLGLGNGSKIFLVALIVFFQFYLNIRDETHGINRKYFDSLYTLGGGRSDLLLHIILPALLPRIFSSLRLTLGTAIAVLFLAETFATRQGIGWYIMDAWSRIAYNEMYAGIAALSFAGLVLFGFLDLADRKVCRWKNP
jgi:ABC-type nitrate/sulfonate/bicarbonate transport system permease component